MQCFPVTIHQGHLFLNDDYQWEEMLNDDYQLEEMPNGSEYDLLTVCLHEILHILGVGHSSEKNAVMYFEYSGVKRDLHDDDIRAINDKYGKLKRRYLRKLPKSQWIHDKLKQRSICGILKQKLIS